MADGMNPLQKSVSDAIAKQLAASISPSPLGPSAFLKPLAALAIGAGIWGGSKALQSASLFGVEDEVVGRFREEAERAGQSPEDFVASGKQDKVKKLYRDLSSMAPVLASNPAMAHSAIRQVAATASEGFRGEDVKNIVDTEKTLAERRPGGTGRISAVKDIFTVLPG